MVNAGDLASAVQFQPDMLPHSPEAEQMAKYVTMPMTLYSGLPNVSVPIYDLKTKAWISRLPCLITTTASNRPK